MAQTWLLIHNVTGIKMRTSNLLCLGWLLVLPTSLESQDPPQVHPTPEQIINWLKLTDLSSPEELSFPQRLGPEAIPTLNRILENREQFSEKQVKGALGLAAFLSVRLGKAGTELLPIIRPYLLDDDPDFRFAAAHAIGKVGGAERIPVLVNFLYDSDDTIRYVTVQMLGEIGDESALLSLMIWRRQAMEADKDRPLHEKWLTAHESRNLDKAIAAIKSRIEQSGEG